ncbi:MAG TPA: hypothetical protein VLI71_16850 [Gammaproteobacteria bacterium]|nr:hypothetical protein [Gammaproteobacteria bacterium]
MYPLEIGFILVALGFLVAQNVRGLGTKYPYVLLAAGLATIVLTVFLGQMRWQMAPAYLLFAILCLLFLKRSYSRVAIRAVGVAFGVLLLTASAVTGLCKSDVRCRAASNMDGGPTAGDSGNRCRLALVRDDQRSFEYLLLASRSDFYRPSRSRVPGTSISRMTPSSCRF